MSCFHRAHPHQISQTSVRNSISIPKVPCKSGLQSYCRTRRSNPWLDQFSSRRLLGLNLLHFAVCTCAILARLFSFEIVEWKWCAQLVWIVQGLVPICKCAGFLLSANYWSIWLSIVLGGSTRVRLSLEFMWKHVPVELCFNCGSCNWFLLPQNSYDRSQLAIGVHVYAVGQLTYVRHLYHFIGFNFRQMIVTSGTSILSPHFDQCFNFLVGSINIAGELR